MTKDNHLLGNFELTGLPPAPRGIPKIEVTFDIDANGILSVIAEEKATGKKNQIVIHNDKGRLSKSEIEKMIADAEKFKSEDEKNRLKVQARNSFESYCLDLLGSTQHLPEQDGNKVSKEANEGLRWLESHPTATAEEIDERRAAIERVCAPIMSNLYRESGMQGLGSNRRKSNDNNGAPIVDEPD